MGSSHVAVYPGYPERGKPCNRSPDRQSRRQEKQDVAEFDRRGEFWKMGSGFSACFPPGLEKVHYRKGFAPCASRGPARSAKRGRLCHQTFALSSGGTISDRKHA